LKPISSGTYRVNNNMLVDLRRGISGQHASNLGALLAYGIAEKISVPAYIVDPVVVDEMKPIAKISGMTDIREKKTSLIPGTGKNTFKRGRTLSVHFPKDN